MHNTMFSWDSQCMGTTNISGCEDQTEVISDNGGMIWGS
jgi:hypothetical protein